MPKKLGKGGHGDQNYVPAGNGDASGEYGDDASGSNIHYFSNFEKPTEEKPSEEVTVIVEDEPKKTYKGFDDYISNSKFKKDFKDSLTTSFYSGNNEAKETIGNLVSQGKITYDRGSRSYCRYGGGIIFSTSNISGEEKYRNEGETFWHENFHAVDSIYGKKFGTSIFSFGATSKVTLSNGKTLCQTLKEEVGRGEKGASEKYQRIMQIEKDFREELAKKDKMIKDKYENDPKYKEEQALMEKMQQERNRIANSDLPFEEKRKKIMETFESPSTPLTTKYNNELANSKIELLKDWGNVSDIFAYATKRSYGLGIGHTSSYFKDANKGGEEFFAEYCGALSRESGKKEVELMKKYFPETAKMCEELYHKAMKELKQ